MDQDQTSAQPEKSVLRTAWENVAGVVVEMGKLVVPTARAVGRGFSKVWDETKYYVPSAAGTYGVARAMGLDPIPASMAVCLSVIGTLFGHACVKSYEDTKVSIAKLAFGAVVGGAIGLGAMSALQNSTQEKLAQMQAAAAQRAASAPGVCAEHKLKSGDILIRAGQPTVCP